MLDWIFDFDKFPKCTKDFISQRLYRHLSNGYKVTIEKIHLHTVLLYLFSYMGIFYRMGNTFMLKTYEIGMR